jgi:hypothetical protein
MWGTNPHKKRTKKQKTKQNERKPKTIDPKTERKRSNICPDTKANPSPPTLVFVFVFAALCPQDVKETAVPTVRRDNWMAPSVLQRMRRTDLCKT